MADSLVTTDNFAIIAYPSNDKFVTAVDVAVGAVIVGTYANGVVVDNAYTNVTVNTSMNVGYGNVQPATISV